MILWNNPRDEVGGIIQQYSRSLRRIIVLVLLLRRLTEKLHFLSFSSFLLQKHIKKSRGVHFEN